jgi:hypothetical protein
MQFFVSDMPLFSSQIGGDFGGVLTIALCQASAGRAVALLSQERLPFVPRTFGCVIETFSV